MNPGVFTLLIFICWTTGVCESVLITQWPRYISSHSNSRAEIHCYQNDTDHQYLYWYRQLKGGDIQLIVYLIAGSANFEDDFKPGYEAVSHNKQWSLTILSIERKDEAVYLCAAIEGQEDTQPAYFGQGTKLTVLEPSINITKPKVKVLPPSSKECRHEKKDKRTKTLVCVASDFYPDHVSVSWTQNGIERTEGVATDSAALRNESFYSITSRLRVPAEQWFTIGINFTCIVSFFNGSNTVNVSASIVNSKEIDGGINREKYLKITQNAKLSYSVLIVKSCIYGAFVCFLVWKLQKSADKAKK